MKWTELHNVGIAFNCNLPLAQTKNKKTFQYDAYRKFANCIYAS